MSADQSELCPFHCRCQEAADKIELLRNRLSQALRQWRMYAEMNEDRDLAKDDDVEARLYRELASALPPPSSESAS